MNIKSILRGVLLLLAALALTACRGAGSEETPGDAYQIYYLNASMTQLSPWEYRTETKDPDLLIQELMEQFLHVPNDVDSQAALSDKVGYLGYRQED